MNRALLAAVALFAVPAAYAQTVPVDGTDYEIRYSGADVSGAVLDPTGSLDIDVSADDDATLRVTVPPGVFGSSDPSSIEVLVDYRPVQFEAESDGSDIVVSVQLDITSNLVQILYDDLGAGPAEPPAPRPQTDPPRAETAPPPAEPEPAEPQVRQQPPAQAAPPPASSVVCGEGTYELDGMCVASCGPGLVFEDGACAPLVSAPAPALGRDLVYGTAAGFAVAFAAIIVLWAMARASRSQQP